MQYPLPAHPAAQALYQVAVAPGGDAVACLMLADLVDAEGDDVTAAAWRWLGRNHEVMHSDADTDDPFGRCLLVWQELLPEVVRFHLPRPLTGDAILPGDTRRVAESVWVDREAFILDFLNAWRQVHEEPAEVFQLKGE